MQNLRVLIVEAELIISKYLSVSLQEKGFDVIGTPFSIEAAIEEFRNSRPHLMIVDTQLGVQTEIVKSAQKIRKEFQTDVPIVFLTTFPAHWSQTEKSEICIVKPFSEIDLCTATERALGNRLGACHET
ncbi:MAG: response regulator [Desulfomonilaceae bacterium]